LGERGEKGRGKKREEKEMRGEWRGGGGEIDEGRRKRWRDRQGREG